MKLNNSAIETLQQEIFEKQKQLKELRLAQPLEEIKEYIFKNKQGEDISLDSLFEEGDELLVIHNMGKKCPYCTMWGDGFRGYTEMLSDRMPWVLTTPDDFETMKEFSESRDWNFNTLSFHGISFARDLGFEFEKEGKTFYLPGVSALIKKDGKIFRTAKDSFGPGDLYNPAWHFFDLFPKGANKWNPKYAY
jgi:predicted dithiol-disulfide oxidoreductase (DUF899 family)